MIVSGFSGNEMFCLAQKGFTPGSIVVGNSVQSLGVVGSITSGLRTVAGGEIDNLTRLIVEGRHAAIQRLEAEARQQQADGVTGVSSDLKNLGGFKEFIAIGSTVNGGGGDVPFFTTACSGQDLYCQIDAGYQPRHFVMGNVAYALGISRGVFGLFRGVAGGEVKEISEAYNHVRHVALERLEKEALERGANAVVDVQTQIISLGIGANEMLMVGTASHHPALGRLSRPVTSELTGEELWNLTKLGYVPLRLLLGTSVYSLGVGGSVGAFFQGLSRGEVDGVTKLIYEARSNCLAHVQKEAAEVGADAVIGVKMFIYEIGSSFVEVMAIGTAIKKMAGLRTQSEVLIPQAVIRDRDTFFDNTHVLSSQKLDRH